MNTLRAALAIRRRPLWSAVVLVAAFGGVAVLTAAVVESSSADAFTLGTNTRERPHQEVDLHSSEGITGALGSLRFYKLASAFDELIAMPQPGALGGPRSDLSWRALIDFADGRLAFKKQFSAAEGLGPGYNDTACSSCHSAPNVGGGGKDMSNGVVTVAPPDDPKDTVGTQKHFTDGRKVAFKETSARRRTPPLYGIGLLDNVPDGVLKALADPTDADKDGIRGILNERGHPAGGVRPARFGHKANESNLLRFIGAALFGEMGVTNRASRARPKDDDKVADPEAPIGYVARVDAYVRNLAPPPRGPITAAAKRGGGVFMTLGCTGCHRPVLGRLKGAFTDLLVHDLGPAVSDGLYDGKAGPTMWRTPALWGVRHKKRLLHDERAADFDAALAFHGGEASKAAGRYRGLAKADRAALKAFLASL
jgi:CxxC motif-containing protein (DUF1111 family)